MSSVSIFLTNHMNFPYCLIWTNSLFFFSYCGGCVLVVVVGANGVFVAGGSDENACTYIMRW